MAEKEILHLNFIKSGNGYPVVILHGLFGMLDNWKTIARSLEENFSVYLIDQRNHGKSPHTDAHSYKLMAEDLYTFFIQHKITSAHIIGHSMGGKTAMQFALDHPEKVNKLIVVDMGIKRYQGGHDEIFDALKSVDLTKIKARKDAEQQLSEKVDDPGVQQFLLKNLSGIPGGNYHWKFNLDALFANYETEILTGIGEGRNYAGEVLFVRGELSKYIRDEDWESIQSVFPKAKLLTVKDSGHWVHAEKPKELLEIIITFLFMMEQ